ncbi:ParB N-terminal domain-containing protein [Ereboglobus luteus]|uniref:ParB N-terminal domain-containing protein n=1 Tax=Ereboglobus luteus TaxID=1796921 RepID=UPI0012603655|nr:ParB N-terminal domain-containing protein [Ereboglobus luteus]
MEKISEFLTPLRVKIDQLLLDPNNPRFAELGENIDQVPENRFAEERVQKAAFEKMKVPKFNVAELRDTIKELGFLPMDRIVVREWREKTTPQKYIVIEGNRRLTALTWLLELHDAGKETFSKNQLESLGNFEVLLLDSQRAPKTARWILPGLRHVSGIKEWGPYQKARMVFELRNTGKTPQEVAQSLGLSTRESNQLWRAFLALEQMGNDEEYQEYAEPKLYSYFEEVFKRPNVREWLGWSDEQQKFTKEKEIREFYGWMKGEIGENNELSDPKLPEAKSVRDFSKIIEDSKALAIFRSNEGTLTHALARLEADNPIDYISIVTTCESTLRSLPPDILRKMNESELNNLELLRSRIDQILIDRTHLLGGNSGEVKS